ncbi:MAG: hypothetical protein II172_00905, partial [Bacteroidales bacterium]|nr:hypothetical protein [Bacteroidales bacterium]
GHRAYLPDIEQCAENPDGDDGSERLLPLVGRVVKDLPVGRRLALTVKEIASKTASEHEHYGKQQGRRRCDRAVEQDQERNGQGGDAEPVPQAEEIDEILPADG